MPVFRFLWSFAGLLFFSLFLSYPLTTDFVITLTRSQFFLAAALFVVGVNGFFYASMPAGRRSLVVSAFSTVGMTFLSHIWLKKLDWSTVTSLQQLLTQINVMALAAGALLAFIWFVFLPPKPAAQQVEAEAPEEDEDDDVYIERFDGLQQQISNLQGVVHKRLNEVDAHISNLVIARSATASADEMAQMSALAAMLMQLDTVGVNGKLQDFKTLLEAVRGGDFKNLLTIEDIERLQAAAHALLTADLPDPEAVAAKAERMKPLRDTLRTAKVSAPAGDSIEERKEAIVEALKEAYNEADDNDDLNDLESVFDEQMEEWQQDFSQPRSLNDGMNYRAKKTLRNDLREWVQSSLEEHWYNLTWDFDDEDRDREVRDKIVHWLIHQTAP